MANVCIQLVTWNGEKYIPHILQSLREQKFTDWELFVLDNGSTDGTCAAVARELALVTQPHHFVQHTTNVGFAQGHNSLFAQTLGRAPYVLLLNQDMLLDPSYIEKLYYFLEAHDDVASVSGRLMRWDFPHKTNIIDSLGLKALPNLRVVELEGGRTWSDEDDIEAREVFGVSGAVPMYRSDALRSVMFEQEVFDKDFFSYKEDVDLAWRLRLAGWTAFTVLDAVVYHDRSASGPEDLSDRAARQNRKRKSQLANYYSYRNHLMMLIKNYGRQSSWRHMMPMLWYELKKAGYLLLIETQVVVRGLWDVLRLLPRMLKKRKQIQHHVQISTEELNQWFGLV